MKKYILAVLILFNSTLFALPPTSTFKKKKVEFADKKTVIYTTTTEYIKPSVFCCKRRIMAIHIKTTKVSEPFQFLCKKEVPLHIKSSKQLNSAL